MRRKFFEAVLGAVCDEAGVSAEDVLRCNREECVDARYVVIVVLSERLSDKQIAEVSGWSVQLVSKVKSRFSERCRFRWGLKGMYKKMLIFSSEEEQ